MSLTTGAVLALDTLALADRLALRLLDLIAANCEKPLVKRATASIIALALLALLRAASVEAAAGPVAAAVSLLATFSLP